jgi:hypothetical protein
LLLVAPTPEQLAALSPEQRAKLSKYVDTASRYDSDLGVAAPGWGGVVAAIDAVIAREHKDAAERETNIETERASYRAILASGRYYEPGSMPPKAIQHDVPWKTAPNYSKNDPEAQRLWAQIEQGRAAERRRMILEADAALSYDVVNGQLSQRILDVLEASRVWSGPRTVQDPVPERAQAFSERHNQELTAKAKAQRETNESAIRAIIAEHGSASDIERHDAGVLPSAEREELIARVLFAPLADLSLYDEVSEQEVADECECDVDDVRFSASTVEQPELSSEQFVRLKAVRAAAPEGAIVQVREHVGYERGRDGADEPEIRRMGVRVTVEFAGEKYRQEYAI